MGGNRQSQPNSKKTFSEPKPEEMPSELKVFKSDSAFCASNVEYEVELDEETKKKF